MKTFLTLFGSLFLINHAAAATFTGDVIRISAIGNKTYVLMINGKFQGTPSECSYADDAMIFSINNQSETGRLLIDKVTSLKNKRQRATAYGNHVCTDNTLYRNAQSEALTSISASQ